MQAYSIRIRRRRDGLVVARIHSLSKIVGYGLDPEEALSDLFKCLRAAPRNVAELAKGSLGSVVAVS